jgi:hypothetical protein
MSQILCYRTTQEQDKVILLVKDVKGGQHEVGPVDHEDLLLYMQGTLIQRAFPYLSIEDRELIITGYTAEMWEDLVNGIGSL